MDWVMDVAISADKKWVVSCSKVSHSPTPALLQPITTQIRGGLPSRHISDSRRQPPLSSQILSDYTHICIERERYSSTVFA